MGASKLKSPPRNTGFNRSLALEGFTNPVSGDEFKCGDSPEFVASVISTNISLLYNDIAGRCPLSSITMHKSAGADPQVHARLNFEACDATVIVGVKKNPEHVSNLVPWMRHICHKQTTTTKPDITIISSQSQVVAKPVGIGTCDASVLKRYPLSEVKTLDECHQKCRGDILAKDTLNKEIMCRGYAFNKDGGDKACITYNMKDVDSTDPNQNAYSCFNMTEVDSDIDTSTVAPLTEEEIIAMSKAPTLSVSWGADTALIEQVGDAGSGCAKEHTYFTLQDEFAKLAQIPVDQTQWDEMLQYIPEMKAPTCSCAGVITADRAAFVSTDGTAQYGPDGAIIATGTTEELMGRAWSGSCSDIPTPPPPILPKECIKVEMLVSVFLGLSLPLFVWGIVGIIYFLSFGRLEPEARDTGDNFSSRTSADFKTGNSESSKLIPSGKPAVIQPNKCEQNTFLLLVVVTIILSLVLAWLDVEFLSVLISSIGCTPSFHDLLCIKIAGGLSCMIAVVLGLRYMGSEKYERPKEERLVLGRVGEDEQNKQETGVLLGEQYYYHGMINNIEHLDGRFRLS